MQGWGAGTATAQLKNSCLQTLGFFGGQPLVTAGPPPQSLKLKSNFPETCGHLSLTLSMKCLCKGKRKPILNLVLTLQTYLPRCPNGQNTAHTPNVGILRFPDLCAYFFGTFLTALPLPCHWVLPPRCTGGVRRSRDTFACLLSLCARVGWHGHPRSITHPVCSAASSPRHCKRGKIFQFKLTGTELGIAPHSHNDEPCSGHPISQPCVENKVYLWYPMVRSSPKALP